MLNYFDLIICLTQENRKDRHRRVIREFKTLHIEPEWFYAVPGIGPHQSFTLSEKAILEKFLASDKQRLLHFEDDMCVRDQEGLLGIKDLPDNWEVLYLGANILKAEKFTTNLYRVLDARTTHAVAYSRQAAEKILKHFPNENEVMYDEYLGLMLPELKAYVLNPMVCWQSAGHSDIWGGQVNYNKVFRDSQRKLQ